MIISKIIEIDGNKRNILKMIVFNKGLSSEEKGLLKYEFNLDEQEINNSVQIYRDLALVLELKKESEEHIPLWDFYLKKHFPRAEKISKLENIFLSEGRKKLLLLTNSRMYNVDLRRINEKIRQINLQIDVDNSLNQKLKKEGFFGKIKKIFS